MSDFESRLKSVFADTFETTPDAIDDSYAAGNANWDSMHAIVLATSLEAEFDIEFSDDELLRLDSYRAIRDALVAKGCA